jgi:6-phosphogluconolactonase (cycloisomerase 2 family)
VATPTPGQGPLGFTFDANGRLIVTEGATNSVTTFAVGRDAELTKVSEVATGQTGTCSVIGTVIISTPPKRPARPSPA